MDTRIPLVKISPYVRYSIKFYFFLKIIALYMVSPIGHPNHCIFLNSLRSITDELPLQMTRHSRLLEYSIKICTVLLAYGAHGFVPSMTFSRCWIQHINFVMIISGVREGLFCAFY